MMHCFKFLLVALAVLASVHGQDNGESKCGSCTTPSPPPPSPPPPSPCPPPPAPVLPPPPKKPTPSTPYCPPPPSSAMIYITGPPGQLYPIDQDFNGAHGVRSSVGLPVMLGVGLLGVLAFW